MAGSWGTRADKRSLVLEIDVARGSMIALTFKLEVRLVTYQREVMALNLGT